VEETFPDIGNLSDAELRELIDSLTAEEQEISYRRRLLHGKIDILRAELVNRPPHQARGRGGRDQRGGRREALRHPRRQERARRRGPRGQLMAVHCPECGFVNDEGANYCGKCGAYLQRPEGTEQPTTMTYKVDDTGDMHPVDIDEVVEEAGAALVFRSGGGRGGGEPDH